MFFDVVKGYDKRNAELLHGLMLKKFDILAVQDKYEALDMLWGCSSFIKFKSPLWSGTMQAFVKGKYSKQSSVLFLPMINPIRTGLFSRSSGPRGSDAKNQG